VGWWGLFWVLRWVAPVCVVVVVCREQPSVARALGQLSVCEGVRFLLAPPSSVLRLNPFFCMPKEGVNVRSPFQATIPCDLSMLPQSR